MINGLNRVLAQLTQALRSDDNKAAGDSSRMFQRDATPGWHSSDHWQNMLACPLDARRYVLEDWSDTYEIALEDLNESRIDSFSGRRVRQFN